MGHYSQKLSVELMIGIPTAKLTNYSILATPLLVSVTLTRKSHTVRTWAFLH